MTNAMKDILNVVGYEYRLIPATKRHLSAAKELFESLPRFKLAIKGPLKGTGTYLYCKLDDTIYCGPEPVEYVRDFSVVEEWASKR